MATKLATYMAANRSFGPVEAAVELLQSYISGGLPVWTNRSFTYVGSTNNVNVITYKNGATSVATVTYTYVAAGAADDDDVLTETLAIL